MLRSSGLTKVQLIILLFIIVSTIIGGVYFFSLDQNELTENIKIGILVDLDMDGEGFLNGAILAAEQLNAQGGVLGREVEIIAEDSDILDTNQDPSKIIQALNRLITYHNVDLVVCRTGENYIIETAAEHKKILIGSGSPSESLTQSVLDNYNRYKYFFRISVNDTAFTSILVDSLLHLRELTGFNKMAYLGADVGPINAMTDILDTLPDTYGFDLVYPGKYPWGTIDLSSYFAAAETAGAEIMVPLIISQEGITFVNEWYQRESSMFIWGTNALASAVDGWNNTNGAVEHTVGIASSALDLDYPATPLSLTTKEAYISRWGSQPMLTEVAVYDFIRFLLSDAIERAGTIETEALIQALEDSNVDNSLEYNFRFTSSHDHYIEPGSETIMMFQWQEDGKMAIVYPKSIMEKENITLTYPDWQGPWS